MRPGTMLLVLWLAGCVSTKPDPAQSQRPVLLDTVVFQVNPSDVYNEAFTLAFEQGYQISYASQEEMMLVIDLPSPSALLDIGTAWVQRIGILVRNQEARGVLYLRYSSYDPEDGDVRVVEADREIAEVFLSTLKQRLRHEAEP